MSNSYQFGAKMFLGNKIELLHFVFRRVSAKKLQKYSFKNKYFAQKPHRHRQSDCLTGQTRFFNRYKIRWF